MSGIILPSRELVLPWRRRRWQRRRRTFADLCRFVAGGVSTCNGKINTGNGKISVNNGQSGGCGCGGAYFPVIALDSVTFNTYAIDGSSQGYKSLYFVPQASQTFLNSGFPLSTNSSSAYQQQTVPTVTIIADANSAGTIVTPVLQQTYTYADLSSNNWLGSQLNEYITVQTANGPSSNEIAVLVASSMSGGNSGKGSIPISLFYGVGTIPNGYTYADYTSLVNTSSAVPDITIQNSSSSAGYFQPEPTSRWNVQYYAIGTGGTATLSSFKWPSASSMPTSLSWSGGAPSQLGPGLDANTASTSSPFSGSYGATPGTLNFVSNPGASGIGSWGGYTISGQLSLQNSWAPTSELYLGGFIVTVGSSETSPGTSITYPGGLYYLAGTNPLGTYTALVEGLLPSTLVIS